VFKATPFHIDNNRFYYEPRVLWSVARVGNTIDQAYPPTSPPTQSATQPTGYVKLDKSHFQNPGKYPIRITHAIVSPVGYLFRDRIATVSGQVDQCMAGLGRVKMRVSFPKSSWIERIDTDVMSFANTPTAEPSLDDDADLNRASGLFGVSRWTFDPSYIMPSRSILDFELSAIGSYQNVLQPVSASMLFMERGGRMLGHGRTRAPEDIQGSPSLWAPNLTAWPQSHVPTIGDFFAANNGAAGAGKPAAFPPEGKFKAYTYNHQLASRGLPYTEVTGFAIALDQIAIDTAAIAQFGEGRIAPIAQRIITKAKNATAGTLQPWWRDGAPLSLVTPTQNNAAWVHKWDQPFELGPGEYLEVSLQAPPPRTMTFGVPTSIQPVYNVGVSFLGYAVVEDNNAKMYRDFADTAV